MREEGGEADAWARERSGSEGCVRATRLSERAGPGAGSGVGERAAQGRVWAGLREREGELGGSWAGSTWEKVKRWVGPGSKLGWVSFGFYPSYFYLLSHFKFKSNKG